MSEAMTEDQRRLRAIADLCDAADGASLRPQPVDYEPIEMPWTTAIRAILLADLS